MSRVFRDEWLVKALRSLPGVTAESVERLRGQQEEDFSEAVLRTGLAGEEAIADALRAAHRIKTVAPAAAALDRLALSLVPEALCRQRRMLPLKVEDEVLQLAMANPLDTDALGDARAISGRDVRPFYCLPGRLEALLRAAYDPNRMLNELLRKVGEDATVEILDAEDGSGRRSLPDKDDAPLVTQLANALVARAVTMGASDIHVEHEEAVTTVRFRIDGALRSVMMLPRALGAGPLLARIKIMADLDIADRLRPQDGRAKLRVGPTMIGLRVSTLPTTFGEKAVLRILDTRATEVPFSQLGFETGVSSRLTARARAAQGMILVTGPTGSGKTTTLYSLLQLLKSEENNLVTVEDPVEYRIAGVNQVQVNEKQGLTFASVLRSVLRQDPDVILVGEIRDQETADVAFQAAMTGHTVFSTLHTIDAISVVARLADMGVERYKIAPGLLAVTAQRLVRRLCPECREPAQRAADLPREVFDLMTRAGFTPAAFRAVGCAACNGGYRGRVALVEFLDVSPELRDRIVAGEPEAALRRFALEKGLLFPLRRDALRRVCLGESDLKEASPYLGLALDEPGDGTPPPAPRSGTRRLLVVDDDSAMRESIRDVLESEGFAVTEAADGREAVERIAEDPPDGVIVDMHMPGLDGCGLIREVRQRLCLLRLPILVLSGADDDANQSAALDLGADDYVLKPPKVAVLLSRVRAAMRRAEAFSR
ncbi:MAG TPA: ATPase, T2SS/T4P/T4SS family [Elusimicrobiota bacterium]|jgi:type IV pilus assembly protein PilB|nr:ATPase, T2SS/T4P/T4SS family [Elusimicrobiota bacterium]